MTPSIATEARVRTVRELTPRVREFVFERTDGLAWPAHGAGAHVELTLAKGEGEGRSAMRRRYSVVGSLDPMHDDAPQRLRIAVQREDEGGGGSRHLHERVREGARLRVAGPFSDFALDPRDRRVLLIAGGIGITPMFAMARSLARRGRDFRMLFIARTEGDMAYRDALRAVAGDRVTLHATAERGRPDFGALFAAQAPDTRVYVCGPGAMIDACCDAARALGWPDDRVAFERFGGGPRAGDRAFTLTLARSRRTLHVPAHASVLDVLLEGGVDALFDCRRGECGLCTQAVLDAPGGLDHRDRHLTAAQRAKGDALCVCVSRACGERLVLDL